MKKLSEFSGVDAIKVAARVMQSIVRILSVEENRNAKAGTVTELFTLFAANSPNEMREIFAILSEKDPADYTCDGAEAFTNLKTLANDPTIASLFLSQGQTGAAKSSGSASENAKG